MILQLFQGIGFNPYLVFDLTFIFTIFFLIYILYLHKLFKGMVLATIKCDLRKQNMAFVDTGGIEAQVLTYKRNAETLSYKDKKDNFDWPIPKGREQMLPNKIRFVLASTSLGVCYNIGLIGEELNKIKAVLSPKLIANTIDDRSKVMADQLTKDQNKIAMVGGLVGVLFMLGLFSYLIFTKAIEYDSCRLAVETARQVSTTTINNLPPLD